ncbi:hypothetical protein AVT69_gp292 [Pseudomonas phage PhiPA3]|uniref:Uncharacterized protein 294 n=1 Tax=Pseudomonas phage PhiPA3 TaxID=998086 RepID=F8SJD0_BPPA3|nr:hypothetical protein AVT69_gp292 [Pseudomonas phage PhiPA3]AEH03717.1 hypothetical protein [Pseudomonas phage PhiPA3]
MTTLKEQLEQLGLTEEFKNLFMFQHHDGEFYLQNGVKDKAREWLISKGVSAAEFIPKFPKQPTKVLKYGDFCVNQWAVVARAKVQAYIDLKLKPTYQAFCYEMAVLKVVDPELLRGYPTTVALLEQFFKEHNLVLRQEFLNPSLFEYVNSVTNYEHYVASRYQMLNGYPEYFHDIVSESSRAPEYIHDGWASIGV